MTGTLAERALAAAHDYIIMRRERGDRSEEAAWRAAAGRSARRAKRGRFKHATATWGRDYAAPQGRAVRKLVAEADAWEAGRLEGWARAGRVTADGRLRVAEGRAPWTWARVRQTFPHLADGDVLAALLAADGEIEEDFMIRNRNIRLVVEEIVDMHLKRHLPKQIDALMGEVHEELKAERAPADPSYLTPGAEKKIRRGAR